MDTEPAPLRITNPAEAAQMVPYLVGFTPAESLVVCPLQHGRVALTARVDLAAVRPAGALEDMLDRIWARFPDADGYGFAYTADHHAGWDLLTRYDNWLMPRSCETLLVDGDRWHRRSGTSGVVDRYGPIAAHATYLGMPRLDSRTDLEARFASAPHSVELTDRAVAAFDALPPADHTDQLLTHARRLIDRHLPGRTASQQAMTPEDAAQLTLLAQHPAVRDLALLTMNRSNAAQHLSLWQNVIQASPAHGADMTLYLAGMAAWIHGDGASAAIATARTAVGEPPPGPDHPIRQLASLIDNVIPPAAWDRLRRVIADHAHPDVKAALAGPSPVDQRRDWPPAGRPARPRPPSPGGRREPGPGIAI